MGVHLREKKLGKGQISYYLDIYHNKTRWYEFLDIHISKTRPSEDEKEKKRLALEIRSKRENELIVQDNGLLDRSKRKGDFVLWFANYIKAKTHTTHNAATLSMLKRYLGKKPLPFTAITPVWIKGFTDFMFQHISNNTVRCYLMNMSTGLEDAVRAEIIPSNPFKKIEKKQRIRQQDVFRRSFTLEELQHLVETPCKIPSQAREAYLFGCFTGLRGSDINGLKWTEVITKELEGKEEYFIYFQQQKTAGIEYFPLSDQAVELIKYREQEKVINEDSSPYIFPLIKERPKSKTMQAKVNRALKKWAKAAGFDPKQMGFHTSRHTFATNILENSPDADLYTVSKLLGHKTIQATQIYAKVRDKKKVAAVKALPMLNLSGFKLKVA